MPPVYENVPAHDAGLLDALLVAAMGACDYWGDIDAARDQMRLDCIATPPHLRADLLAHFVDA